MPDLHQLSRRYGLPFCADGRSLYLPPGRVVVHGPDLIFSGVDVAHEHIRRLCKLGTTLYRHVPTGSVTVVFRVGALPNVIEIFGHGPAFKRS